MDDGGLVEQVYDLNNISESIVVTTEVLSDVGGKRSFVEDNNDAISRKRIRSSEPLHTVNNSTQSNLSLVGSFASTGDGSSGSLQQLSVDIGTLVAQGDKATNSLEILTSRISPDLLVEAVMSNMRHLPPTCLKAEKWELCKCDMFVKDMTVGVSERTAGVLIVLAWQLRSIVRGKLVFPEDDPAKIITAVEVETLSDTAIMTVTGAPYVRPTTVSNETYIKAVCFIAASMLRLLSKTPDNYRKAYDRHIREAYYKFYKVPFPIQGFDPSDQCIQAIHSLFSNLNVYRNAIGSFLYYHCELTNDKGMCQMLYEQHLGLTGMHAVNLFTRACVALQASAEDLGSALWHRQNKNALETLSHIFYKYVVNEKGEATIARKTWKYARLYDAKYFMAIQTKNCKALVCILAYLCSYAGMQGKQDIMNIVHIKALPAETKERYNKWASMIYAYFDVGETAADGNPFALE